jgi:hypothetical protein
MRALRPLVLIVLLTLSTNAVAADTPPPAPLLFSTPSGAHGSSCDNNRLSERVQFANRHRAGAILGKKDDWALQLSAFDRGIRQKTTAPTNTRAFLNFASDAGLEWTPEERAAWGIIVDRLSSAMQA